MAIQNTFYLDVDIKRDNYVDEPKVTQNDAVTFVLRMTDDGVDYPLAGVSTYTLASLRPDGQSVLTVGTLTAPNEITFELGSTEVSVPGNVKAAIQIYDADGRVSSIPFTYEVTKDIAVDYIPSAEEETLIQLVLGDGPAILNAAELVTAEANEFLANNVRVGEYDNALTYAEGNEVGYDGSSFVALGTTQGNIPTDTAYWALRARKGEGDVNSVNGVMPDASGDVTIPDPDLSGLATKTELQIVTEDVKGDLRSVQNNPTNYNGAIVTIIDDDARSDFRTVWNPILSANPDVKIGVAAVKKWVESGNDLTLQELKDLQLQGHEIYSHTINHDDSNSITPELAELEYKNSQQWLIDNDFKDNDILVYPGGLSTNKVDIKNVARKYYKYAISTVVGGQYNSTPVDNWCVPRIDGDTSTLVKLQEAVESAILNNGWVVIMTHSHMLLEVGSSKMNSFISFVKSKGVPILPFNEAVKYKGNAIAIGEYSDEDDKLFVSNDGNTSIKNSYIHKTGETVMDKPLNTYPIGSTTIQTISYLDDSFLSQGGVLDTIRTFNDAYSYQEFTPINTSEKFSRKWDSANTSWGAFVKINSNTQFITSSTMNKPLTDYPKNSITYLEISYVNDTYLSVGGNMKIYRGGDDSYGYAEYIPFTSLNEKHVRRWNNSSKTWSAWNKI